MEQDEILRKQLASWKVEPEIPVRFQAEVWQKIAARETAREKSFWRILFEPVALVLAQPRYAMAAIFAAAALGLGVARVEASNANAHHWKALETRYVSSIDPYRHISGT